MNNIKLVEQSETQAITKTYKLETYKLEIDGYTYYWLDYVDRKGKVIDWEFRDENGYSISMDKPELADQVMNFLDGLENKG